MSKAFRDIVPAIVSREAPLRRCLQSPCHYWFSLDLVEVRIGGRLAWICSTIRIVLRDLQTRDNLPDVPDVSAGIENHFQWIQASSSPASVAVGSQASKKDPQSFVAHCTLLTDAGDASGRHVDRWRDYVIISPFLPSSLCWFCHDCFIND